MKCLVFDSGPIISLTTNNLLWILEPLKNQFKGDFYITEGVRKELVENPLQSRKFKFEALQVEQQIEKGILKVINDPKIKSKGFELMNITNSCFKADNNPIKIVQLAEMETIAFALIYGAEGIVVDERVTRLLIESPEMIKETMRKRLHANINVNTSNLKTINDETRDLRIIRSVELVTIAYELGILDKFVVNIPNAKKELLSSILWGVKLNGGSVSEREIDELIILESKIVK